jgi:hypothetical protein
MLYCYQLGFRSIFSADTCLIHMLDFIRSNTSKGLSTGMIMLDLQKAFDTVDHKIVVIYLLDNSKYTSTMLHLILIQWNVVFLRGAF